MVYIKTISEKLRDDDLLSSVSDMFGSLSNNKCVGKAGHFEPGYWDDPYRVSDEAFANLLVPMREET